MFVSIDATDYPVQEPHPFDSSFYSHKFNSSGLRYEIGICISTGEVVWGNGPYKCGSWPDLRIFRYKLKDLLLPNELIIADLGYCDNRVILPPVCSSSRYVLFHRKVRARHETLNSRLKNFRILSDVFRHNPDLNANCFFAASISHNSLFYRVIQKSCTKNN